MDVLKLRLSFRTGIYYTFMFLNSLSFVNKIHSFRNKCILVFRKKLITSLFELDFTVHSLYYTETSFIRNEIKLSEQMNFLSLFVGWL